jgi:hypothetical protein
MLPQISDALLAVESGRHSPAVPKDDAPSAIDRSKRTMSEHEFAVWMGFITFLVIYFSCTVALLHNPAIAGLSSIAGPEPFELAALAAGFVYRYYSHESQDK